MVLFCFFFSSRRRHTRSLCDWSSDVCSSDLDRQGRAGPHRWPRRHIHGGRIRRCCLRSEERRVGKSVDLGGRRIIKKQKKTNILPGGTETQRSQDGGARGAEQRNA